MSWRATGSCMNTLITGDASTSCVLESTGGTASGGAPALPLALWDVSLRSTDSHFSVFTLIEANCWAFHPLVPLLPTVFQCGHGTVVSKPEIIHFNHGGFVAFDVGFWFLFGCSALLGKVPPKHSVQATLTVNYDLFCFGRPIAKWFASPVPNLLSYWNYNKWKLDESQLKWAFVNVLLTTTAVTIKRSGG